MVREGVDIAEEPSLYDILQVSPKASSEVIQAAYRVLARTVHPDVSAAVDAEKQTRRLNAAHHVLSDPFRRAAYDASRAEAERLAASRRPKIDARRAPSPPADTRDYPTQRAPATTMLVWAATASVAVTIVVAMLIVLWSLYDTLDSFEIPAFPASGSAGASSQPSWTPSFSTNSGTPSR